METATEAATKTQQADEEELVRYELAFWLEGSLAQDKRQAEKDSLTSFLRELGGKDIKTEDFELRGLAYPIRKQKDGYFGTIIFSLLPEKIEKLQSELKINHPDLLRFLVVKREKVTRPQLGVKWPLEARKKMEREAAVMGRPEEKISAFEEFEPLRMSDLETRKEEIKGKPTPPKEVSTEEIDKKLEELLG